MAPESPENLAAVPVGGGGAWPGRKTTRRRGGPGRPSPRRFTTRRQHSRQVGGPASAGNDYTQTTLAGLAAILNHFHRHTVS